MVALLRQNAGLKLLSVFLAMLGWAYFRFASNPVMGARLDQQISVPIATANLASGYVARFPDKAALITVEPRSGEPPIKPEEIRAVLDLSNRGTGVYNVPVKTVGPNVIVQSLSPASVTLSIERIERKTVAIGVHYAAPGAAVVTALTIAPSAVVLRGPTSTLAQVVAVRVDLPLVPSQAALDEMIRPVPVSSSGAEVRDLQVLPNLVRVQARFSAAVKGP